MTSYTDRSEVPSDPDEAARAILEHQMCDKLRGCTCIRSMANGFGNTHCVAHNEDNPSMTVHVEDGVLLVNCKTGCSQDEVIGTLKKLGLWPYSSGQDEEPPSYQDFVTPDDPDPVPGPGRGPRPNGSAPGGRSVADRKIGAEQPIAREAWQHLPSFALGAVPYDPNPVRYAWALWEHKTGLPRSHWEGLGVRYDAKARLLVVSFGESRDVLRYRPWPPRQGANKYFWDPESRLNPPLWPVPTPESNGDLWIVGGETDAATLRYCQFRAHGTTHGESSVFDSYTLRALVSPEIRAETLHFLYDLEPSAEVGAFKNALACHALGIPCKVPQWPAALRVEGAKDANDVWHGCKHDRARFRNIVTTIARRTPLFAPEQVPPHVKEVLERGNRPTSSGSKPVWGSRYRTYGNARPNNLPDPEPDFKPYTVKEDL